MKKKSLIKLLNFRHACKVFDTQKDIKRSDFKFILNCAKLSPSSFGLEHWHTLVVDNKKIKDKLKPVCWNQEQITTSSKLLVILAKKSDLYPSSNYVKFMFKRKKFKKDIYNSYIKKYSDFIETKNKKDIISWSQKQCYIYATNIVNSAASIGIDSCMIEGFESKKVRKILKIDKKKYEIALIVALGYRVDTPPIKYRLDMEDNIEYIK